MNNSLVVRHLAYDGEIGEVFGLFESACSERKWPTDNHLSDYTKRSQFWAGYIDGQLACAVQLVLHTSEIGLPITKNTAWPELSGIMDEYSAEVAMVAVKKELRGSAFFFLDLYIELYYYCKERNIPGWYAILDPVISRLYTRFGIQFHAMGEPRVYWGQLCFPAFLSISALEQELSTKKPDLWQTVLERQAAAKAA